MITQESQARAFFKNLNNTNQKLYEYIFRFFGYGNLDGKYWFVGIEESGGKSTEEINERVELWHTRGKNITEDLNEYHKELKCDTSAFENYLGANAGSIQTTWEQLIRVILSYQNNKSIERPDILNYQKTELGRIDKDTCLLELLPLPDSRNSGWIYNKYNYDECLNDKNLYVENIIQYRIQKIKELIKCKKPKFVVFYIMSYLNSSYGKYI